MQARRVPTELAPTRVAEAVEAQDDQRRRPGGALAAGQLDAHNHLACLPGAGTLAVRAAPAARTLGLPPLEQGAAAHSPSPRPPAVRQARSAAGDAVAACDRHAPP